MQEEDRLAAGVTPLGDAELPGSWASDHAQGVRLQSSSQPIVSAMSRTSSGEPQAEQQRGHAGLLPGRDALLDVARVTDDVHLLDEVVGDQGGRLVALAGEEELLDLGR